VNKYKYDVEVEEYDQENDRKEGRKQSLRLSSLTSYAQYLE
jgi:hypothetical protein